MMVAVLTRRNGFVRVSLVPVVVTVGMLVPQRLVLVLVAERLSQLQHHAGQRQAAAQRHQATG